METPQFLGKIVLKVETLIIKNVFQISFQNLNLLIIVLLQKFQRGVFLLFHTLTFKTQMVLNLHFLMMQMVNKLSFLLISR